MNAVTPTRSADPYAIKRDFPILQQQINGQPLVYLDNAATTQKPQVVIDAISDYYSGYNANVHRGAHTLSERATSAFEAARSTVAQFIGSPSATQVIWTRGTTESINLVAATWGAQNLKPGQVILASTLEHHSNIVPWQILAEKVGARVLPLPVSETGDIDLAALTSVLEQQDVAMVAVNHASNALGTVNPLAQIIELAHARGAKVLVDGAQAVAHFAVDVEALGCDFYAFSGHKLFGPTGIGVLWGKRELLDAMPPYQGGGEMIETVSFSGTTYNRLPFKFEAGTPDIAGAIGLAAAVTYLQQFDRAALLEQEHELLRECVARGEQAGLKRVGRPQNAIGVYSFLLAGAHPSDLGMLLDQQGVAVRTGHHCAQPLMAHLGITGTVRASFSIYNTPDDIDRLFHALEKSRRFLM